MDAIVAAWRRERPDLDPGAKDVTGRIIRLASIFQGAYAEAFAALGIGGGDYGILATLRRAGEPFTLTPTALARHGMMTSGGMTAAIDRVERKGLVERLPNPDDRRGSLVHLTPAGLELVDRAMAVHVEVEHRLVEGLAERERDDLVPVLRALLLALEPGDEFRVRVGG